MVNRGQRRVVGLNCYQTNGQVQSNLFKVDSEVERIAVERIRELRASRDSARFQRAMGRFTEAARAFAAADVDRQAESQLMPAAIDAARADATTGEMMGVLKEALGWSAPHEF
jgi:methylmalonyl-CoA mutase N-terminal domain/subunit